MSETLTVIEERHYEELLEIVDTGVKTFYEVGMALIQIKENKYHRKTHGTFEELCKDRWGFTSSRARQLIAAAEVQDNLKSVTNVTLQNEGQARPLVSLPLDQQREVYQKACAAAPQGKPTSKQIKKAIGDVVGKKQPSAKEGVTEELGEERVRGMAHPEIETDYSKVTDAMEFANMAISQLERIRDDDPMRKEGIQKVADWCQTNLN